MTTLSQDDNSFEYRACYEPSLLRNRSTRPCPRTVVPPAHCIPPNDQEFRKHAQSVADGADLGVFLMRPLHCHLVHAKPEVASEKEDLRIETPTFDDLQWEYRLRSLALEGFEAALRVFVVHSKN